MKKFYIPFLMLLSFSSCKERFEFYGKDIVVTYPDRIDTLVGYPVKLENEYTGFMSAYDGVLLFASSKHPDGYVYVYNAETGKRTKAICPVGNGPDEVISVSFYECFERDSGKISMWFNDVNKRTIMRVDTQGNILQRIHTKNLQSTNFYGIGMFFILNDSLLLAYMQSEEIFENKILAPSYRVFNYITGETVKNYKLFSDYEVNHRNEYLLPPFYLSASHRIKPDKSKLALAMSYLKQIIILDIKTGKAKAVSIENIPNFEQVFSRDTITEYHREMCCDERYIYVLEGDLEKSYGRVNVFDWEGNFTNVLQINDDAVEFAFDAVRKTLYTKNDLEEITAYDLNFFYK